MTERWGFEVTQDGEVVAEGEGPDEATAMREGVHYGMMYAQDGPPAQVRVYRRKVRKRVSKADFVKDKTTT